MEERSPRRNGAGTVGLITAPARNKRSDRVKFLPRVDGRTLMARRWQELATNLIIDQGGEDHCSSAKLILVKRLAAVGAMLEEFEARYISGDAIDIDKYISLSQLAARLANSIGLSRKARTVPELSDYIASQGYASGLDDEQPRRGNRERLSRTIEHDAEEDDDD